LAIFTVIETAIPLFIDHFNFSDLFNPEKLVQIGGLSLLLFIIFAETGLFFGFFLPGDSLLFVAGLFSGTKYLEISVWLLIFLLIIAATIGTTVGYGFGRWAESYLKSRKESFFYKKKYLEMTEDFYKRYGMMTFILGRFLPVVRTFVPILAGIVRIEFGKFLFYNVIGAAAWIITMVMAGHWLGNIFPGLSEHLEIIVAAMILVTTIPLIGSWMKLRKQVD